MLDITYFVLTDAAVPLEDITTSAGRLWTYGVLNNCHETPGITGVVWGRDTRDPSVVLLIVDLDEEHEEQRLNLAKAVSSFDVYLQCPRVHQCLFDCDNSHVVEQQESLFLVFSFCHPDIGLSPELVDWKIQHKGIQDFPGTVRVNGTLSQDTPVYGAGQGGTEAYLLYNVNVNERMIKAYHNRFADPRICPPDTAKFAHVHHHLVKLTKALALEPPYESPFLQNPSHLFTRNKERYGMRIVGGCDNVDTNGPNISATSPYDSGSSVCFEKRAFYAPSPRFWSPGVWEQKRASFWETASIEFFDEVPYMNDQTSRGFAWLNLLKLLNWAKGVVSVHVATCPRYPNKANIFIEWEDETHSAIFFSSEEYEAAIDALVPFLRIECERSMRIDIAAGIPYDMNPVPVDSLEWMDIVDFVFRPDMSETDKRAFEYLMIQFSDCFRVGDPHGIGHPIFMNERHDHWIEEDESLIYRQEFYWDVEEENEVMAWMKTYLEHGYYEVGIRAHAIALMAEQRRHLRVNIDHLGRKGAFGVG